MHWTVKRTFEAFQSNYFSPNQVASVLEIGSQDINGGLRNLKFAGMNWLGLDLTEGPGVDQVIQIGSPLPFEASSFDLVVASSVFEHDIQFWNTFLEMVRVVSDTGIISLIMPSQGSYHRFPLDAFRFYPDAGIALAEWAKHSNLRIELVESFTTTPEVDVWADYVAIFSKQPERYESSLLGGFLKGENWIVKGEIIQSSYQELPFEMRRIRELETLNDRLIEQTVKLKDDLKLILNSKSWQITSPARTLVSKILKYTKR